MAVAVGLFLCTSSGGADPQVAGTLSGVGSPSQVPELQRLREIAKHDETWRTMNGIIGLARLGI